MKKLFFAFSAFALMTACSQDEFVAESQGTEENALREYTLTAIKPEADTRTYVNETTAYWNDDDVIVVKNYDGSKSATLSTITIDADNKGKATFSGRINFEPSTAVYSDLMKNETSFTYRGSDSYMRSNSPMEGTIIGNSVTFEHTAAIVRFNINDVPADEGGKVALNDGGGYINNVEFSNASGNKNNIILDFPIPADAIKTYSLTYQTTDGTTTVSGSFTTPMNLTAGQIIFLEINSYEDVFYPEYRLDTEMNPLSTGGNVESAE